MEAAEVNVSELRKEVPISYLFARHPKTFEEEVKEAKGGKSDRGYEVRKGVSPPLDTEPYSKLVGLALFQCEKKRTEKKLRRGCQTKKSGAFLLIFPSKACRADTAPEFSDNLRVSLSCVLQKQLLSFGSPLSF